jgi:tellurite resistance protein TerC
MLQHRVLFWGVLGAMAFRAALIVGGVALLERFEQLTYVFGAFLVLTGVRMLVNPGRAAHLAQSRLIQAIRRIVPATDDYRGVAFFVREGGRSLATPLFFVLVLVEVTDVVFALDSIPAILAITTDPFVVFSPRTSSPSSVSGRCTSCWPPGCTASRTSPSASP